MCVLAQALFLRGQIVLSWMETGKPSSLVVFITSFSKSVGKDYLSVILRELFLSLQTTQASSVFYSPFLPFKCTDSLSHLPNPEDV